MDIQSVLEATFPIPTIEPAWQHELLLRLERGDMASTERTAAKPSLALLRPRLSGSDIEQPDCILRTALK